MKVDIETEVRAALHRWAEEVQVPVGDPWASGEDRFRPEPWAADPLGRPGRRRHSHPSHRPGRSRRGRLLAAGGLVAVVVVAAVLVARDRGETTVSTQTPTKAAPTDTVVTASIAPSGTGLGTAGGIVPSVDPRVIPPVVFHGAGGGWKLTAVARSPSGPLLSYGLAHDDGRRITVELNATSTHPSDTRIALDQVAVRGTTGWSPADRRSDPMVSWPEAGYAWAAFGDAGVSRPELVALVEDLALASEPEWRAWLPAEVATLLATQPGEVRWTGAPLAVAGR